MSKRPALSLVKTEPAPAPRMPAVVTFRRGENYPAELNGVAFAPWLGRPAHPDDWEISDLVSPNLSEPPMQLAADQQPAAAVVIVEPDWRVWVAHVCEPFNAAQVRFPAARQDANLSLPATAIREAWEKTGLQVRITGWLGDFDTPTTRTRYYLAERIGGAPHACGWQTPALSLVTCKALASFPALRLDDADMQCLAAAENVMVMLKAAAV